MENRIAKGKAKVVANVLSFKAGALVAVPERKRELECFGSISNESQKKMISHLGHINFRKF